MATIKERVFGIFDYKELPIPKEFFEKYRDKYISAEELENHRDLRDVEIPFELAGDFLGKCRKYHRLYADELIQNSPAVWQAMLDKGLVRRDFFWDDALRKILRAVAPCLNEVYPGYVAKKENKKMDFFDICAPLDYFIAKHYEKLSNPVAINRQVLDSKINAWLPPDQQAMLGWLKGLGNGVSYRYGLDTIQMEVHMSLEMYGSSNGGTLTNYGSIQYRLSEKDSQTLKALYENLCQIIDTCEFQEILKLVVS